MPPADVESPPRAGGRHVEWQDDDWTTMDSRSVTPDSTAEHREQPQPAPAFGRLSSAAELVAEWANEEDDGDSAGPISLLARLFLALDMVGSTLLFFLGGLHNEHAFLDSSTELTDVPWERSLFDVFLLGVARASLLAILLSNLESLARMRVRSLDPNIDLDGRSRRLRAALVLVPLLALLYLLAKLTLVVLKHDLHSFVGSNDIALASLAAGVGFSVSETIGASLARVHQRRISVHTMLMDSASGLEYAERRAHASAARRSINNEGYDETEAAGKAADAATAAAVGESDEEEGEGKAGARGKRNRHRRSARRRKTFKRLYRLARTESSLVSFGGMMLTVTSASTIVAPWFFGRVVDSASRQERSHMTRCVLTLAVIYLIGAVATFARSWAFTYAGQRLVARVRRQLFAKMMENEIAFFDLNRTGELSNRLASDTAVLQNACTINISMLFRYLTQILGSLVIMALLSWKLTLVLLAVVPAVVLISTIYGRYLKSLRKAFQDRLAEASAWSEEMLGSMRTVRSFSNEEYASRGYNKAIDRSLAVGRRLAVVNAGFVAITTGLASLSICAVLWYGGLLVIHGHISTGTLSSFFLYTITVAMGFAFIAGLFGDFAQAVGASVRIFDLLERKPRMNVEGGDAEAAREFVPAVRFENVCFTYPSRPDEQVLHNISLDVKPGMMVALVGPSGSGKTTLIALLERFYDPSIGRILIGGHDLRTLDPEAYRQHVALVGQEPVLFAGTIRDNICFGKGDATDEEVEYAARQANAHEFIESFDKGYDVKVGQRGVRLSGGQKQRIAIARALLMDPRILLLDEATSALDAESEHLVQEAIDRAMKGRTVIVIAHRLSTVRAADKIVVLEKGEIKEMGQHNDLIAKHGTYFRLIQRQLQGL